MTRWMHCNNEKGDPSLLCAYFLFLSLTNADKKENWKAKGVKYARKLFNGNDVFVQLELEIKTGLNLKSVIGV